MAKSSESDNSNELHDEAQNYVIAVSDDAAEVALQTSSTASLGFCDLFAIIADNARVDACVIDSDAVPFRPPALKGDVDKSDDLTGQVCLTATELFNNIVRKRQATMAKDLGPEGHVTVRPSSGASELNVKI